MRLRAYVATLLLSSTLLSSLPVWAQTDAEKAAARSLAAEGVAAMKEKRWADAIERFTRAESLVHAPPHLLNLARANANLGKLVTAREHYLKIVKETLPPTASKAFQAAQQDAQKELAELEPRIPMLKVEVEGEGAKSASVIMDGEALPPAMVGISRPVDPGEHKLTATASGASAKATIDLKEGTKETVTLKLEKDAKPTGGVPDKAPEPEKPAPAPVTSEGPSRVPAIVAFGVGAVGLAIGTVFMLQRSSKVSQGNDLCPGGPCPESRRPAVDELDAQAKSAGTISVIGFAAGVIGVGTGIVLLATSSSKPATTASVQPVLSVGFVGLSGAF